MVGSLSGADASSRVTEAREGRLKGVCTFFGMQWYKPA